MVLLLMIITAVNFGCATNLPADFPKPPVIDFCVPRIKDGLVIKQRCQQSDSTVKRDEPADYVNIGTTIEDYNKGQEYRRTVETWIISRCK